MQKLSLIQTLASEPSTVKNDTKPKKDYLVYILENEGQPATKIGIPLEKVDEFDALIESTEDLDIEAVIPKFSGIKNMRCIDACH